MHLFVLYIPFFQHLLLNKKLKPKLKNELNIRMKLINYPTGKYCSRKQIKSRQKIALVN